MAFSRPEDDSPAPPGQEPSPAASDARLVASVLAGERERFQPLVERYQGAIFGYLYRLLNQETETAQDLTQEVFLKAYQALASYDPARPFGPWLYRIAHNEAANRLRTRARHPETGMDDHGWDALADDGGASPQARQEAAQETAWVNRALLALKPKYRQALTLYYYEEKTYGEIGEMMGLPDGTVATLIRRGRQKMAASLAGIAPSGE